MLALKEWGAKIHASRGNGPWYIACIIRNNYGPTPHVLKQRVSHPMNIFYAQGVAIRGYS